MSISEDLVHLSPLPIVDLKSIRVPQDGILVRLSGACLKNFAKNDVCRQHYAQLSSADMGAGKPVQCPYGFATYPFVTKYLMGAFTGVIPYPRLGGEKERHLAKSAKHQKIPVAEFAHSARTLKTLEDRIDQLERETIERQSVALHEIRKLNRTVKQTSERMCVQDAPHDPTRADPQLVAIWKSSEIMSMQFDVIELLANEKLATLPLTSPGEIYRMFDKCARIYNAALEKERIRLYATQGYRPRVLICDKTFMMIPTALLENALKYSVPGSEISVSFRPVKNACMVEIRNTSNLKMQLSDEIFKKGVRLSSEKEGSGNGLYLARLVSQQHGATLQVSTRKQSHDNLTDCTFLLSIPEFKTA